MAAAASKTTGGQGYEAWSISVKLLLPLVAGGLAIGVVGGYVAAAQGDRAALEEANRRAAFVVQVVRAAAAVAGDDAELARVVGALGLAPGVALVAVTRGVPARVVAASRPEWLQRDAAELADEGADSTPTRLVATDDLAVRALLRPDLALSAPGDGEVHVRFAAAAIRRRVTDAEARAGLLYLGSIALLTLLSFVLVRRTVLRPLAWIGDAIARRRAGDGSALAPPSAPDEIGRLAASFNDLLRAIDEGETRFQQIAEHVDDCFWIIEVGEQVRCRFVSQAYEALTGRSCESLYAGIDGHALGVHPDDVDTLYRAWGDLQLEPKAVEFRLIRTDGEARWVRCRWFPVFRPDGALQHVVGVTTDVTERKRAERLAGERSRLTALVATVGIALNRTNGPGAGLGSALEALRASLDASFAGVWTRGDDPHLVLRAHAGEHPGDAGDVAFDAGTFGRLMAERRPLGGSCADGAHPAWVQAAGWTSFAGHPLLVGDRVVGVVVVYARRPLEDLAALALASLADLAAQQLAREEVLAALRCEQERKVEALAAAGREAERRVVDLAKAEQRLRAIVDGALDAVVTIDAVGRVSAWSPQAEATFGWSASEALGRPLAELIAPPDVRPAIAAGLQRFLRTGEPGFLGRRHEVTAVHRSGRAFPLELSVTGYRRDDDWHFTAFARDITVRKEAEAQLIEARESAIELAQMKSNFLATMSHEIRTPMNAVIGMTGLLADTALDDEQRDYVRTVRTAGEQLLTIINDILDFSKIESGRLALEVVVFELRPILEEVLDLFADPAHAKGIELVLDLDPAVPPWLSGDVGRLRQVLANLVGNAVKFTEMGEIVLSVEPAAAGSGGCRFVVTDTGIGISPEHRTRLFDPFVQVDGSFTRRYEGTGLGLSIARQLVLLMRGEIGFDSIVGVGSRFWFTAEVSAASVSEPTDARRDLRGRCVLLVDDNESCRRATAQLLERWGATVVTAADGPDALERVRSRPAAAWDLAIIDQGMPLLDGDAVAARLRHSPGLRDLPVLLLASAGGRPARDVPLPERRQVVQKPLRAAALYPAIASLLESPRLRAVAALPLVRVPPRRGRVLVVEDNVINQRLMCALLRRLGFEAESAANGAEALSAWERGHFALILMDCQMPVMDGFEATRQIRARERDGVRTPIVAITANVMPGTRERCHDVGMDDYLSKPVRLADLEEAMSRWVGADAAPMPDSMRIDA